MNNFNIIICAVIVRTERQQLASANMLSFVWATKLTHTHTTYIRDEWEEGNTQKAIHQQCTCWDLLAYNCCWCSLSLSLSFLKYVCSPPPSVLCCHVAATALSSPLICYKLWWIFFQGNNSCDKIIMTVKWFLLQHARREKWKLRDFAARQSIPVRFNLFSRSRTRWILCVHYHAVDSLVCLVSYSCMHSS
jgi:hypothetical protein